METFLDTENENIRRQQPEDKCFASNMAVKVFHLTLTFFTRHTLR